ncbi:MAG: 50S ribosomal protein L28 [Bryobacteraceae bacterium]
MAQFCKFCGKKPISGNRVSHAHNLTRRRWNVNLQRVHVLVDGVRKHERVCTSCIRSGKVTKVL